MIVDDNVVSVMELEEVLSAHNFDVAGVAYTGPEAVKMEREIRPDLILMDIKMPGDMDGISAADAILQQRDIPFIFVTGHGDEELLLRASKLDPAGYILKPFTWKQILATIELVLLKTENLKAMEGAFSKNWGRRLAARAMLTPSETRIANFIKTGKCSKDIALELCVTKKTVDWHRTNIRKKLGCADKDNLFSIFQKI